MPVGVVDEGDVAVGAEQRLAAGAAEDDGRQPAPVEEEDRLLARRQGALQQLAQPLGEEGGVAAVELEPHVDDLDRRQLERAAAALAVAPAEVRPDPVGQLEAPDLALLRPPGGLDGRRRAAEEHDRAALGGEPLGQGAGVVAGVGVLLVGPLVLLVEDDQPEVAQRGEEGRARADDDAAATGGDRLPGGVALGVGQGGVEDGDLVRESGR